MTSCFQVAIRRTDDTDFSPFYNEIQYICLLVITFTSSTISKMSPVIQPSMLISYSPSNTNLYTPIIVLNFDLFSSYKNSFKRHFILKLGLLQTHTFSNGISFDVRNRMEQQLPNSMEQSDRRVPNQSHDKTQKPVLPCVTPHVRIQARDSIQNVQHHRTRTTTKERTATSLPSTTTYTDGTGYLGVWWAAGVSPCVKGG